MSPENNITLVKKKHFLLYQVNLFQSAGFVCVLRESLKPDLCTAFTGCQSQFT